MANRPGSIWTFYSYKGGSGRSMTAASVAWILASNGKRVLAIDWDLEAPGLHHYFAPFLDKSLMTSSGGLIELLYGYLDRAQTPAPEGETEWLDDCADIKRFAVSLDWDFPRDGMLDFVHAGRQDQGYAERVSKFDWRNFYNRFKGGGFLELVKKQMRRDYDYIVIDSRSGRYDSASIASVQMPDSLVVCATLSIQSIEGSNSVATLAKRQRPELRIFPIVTRVDMSAELEKTQSALSSAWQILNPLVDHLPPDALDAYRREMQFPFVPAYAFEERLAVFDERSVVRGALVTPTERLVSYLTNGEVTHAAPIPAQTRKAVTAWSLDRGLEGSRQPRTPKPVMIFVSYSHLDKKYLQDHSLLGFLGGVKNNGEAEFWWDEQIVTGNKWDDEIKTRISQSDIALVLASQTFLNSAYCQKVEIPAFIRECEQNGMVIFPVIISACDWESQDWLRDRQIQPKKPKNIEEHYSKPGVRKALFLKIYYDLKKQIEEKRNGSGGRPKAIP